MSKNLIGSDIEVFLYDESKKEFYPVIGLIGAGKHDPLMLDQLGCSIQEDGVAAEFNVCPTTDPEHMWKDIQYCLTEIRKRLPEFVDFKIVSSARFKKEVFDHPQAMELGCEPDFNAWDDGKPNQKPEINSDTFNLRTTGGHIHMSLEESLMLNRISVIRAMDFFLGIPSLLLDNDKERRKLYGKAGAYRTPHYGVEYRTLSNFWMRDKKLVEWVFNQTYEALEFVRAGFTLTNYLGYDETKIRDIINNNDIDAARDLCEQHNLMPKVEVGTLISY